jgi:c-di-GMP-binding flagellar brake protein YcgR
MPLSGLVNIEFKEKGKIHSIQTVIANVSLRGMGLYSYNSLKIKTVVSITMNFIFTDGSLKSNSLNGQVVSNKKIDKIYFIGIQFHEEVDPKKQPFLFKYIHS